ncbi:MAG: (E)-4-hydroxy-3-methylbut-2-enyl-diphosphate synthase [Bacteroidales bacterium]|nr:(E)-4-hydroxy-3-methylbut-2-enyl-diphosphate synthase [Bacteroidales bacterium]
MPQYKRRPTTVARVGRVGIGGDNPIRIQSMTNTSTRDIPGSIDQIRRLAEAGAEIVRLTAQGEPEARAMGEMRRQLQAQGVNVPLVADIHFNRRAAFVAAEEVEKVRINPGNFADPGRVFRKIEYTDAEYQAEVQRVEDTFKPLIDLCREQGVALRIGVNHGSLSDRIMSRYGDTPAGMVESAMEYLRVCQKERFDDVVISIKSSRPLVMIETVKMLVKAMDAEDMHYPLHLGVTEAGDGEDGRVKSAVGIGSLLRDGIGDTIRVSLSEDPVNEIPVARFLAAYTTNKERGRLARATSLSLGGPALDGHTNVRDSLGGPALDGPQKRCHPLAIARDKNATYDPIPDAFLDEISATVISHPDNDPLAILEEARRHDGPVIPLLTYHDAPADDVAVMAAADLGYLLVNGLRYGAIIEADSLTPAEAVRLTFNIFQAAGLRQTKAEFISCPGCGRTLFDLQETLARVKAATNHLKHLKIGVMGCVVNGPGEMADADFGYVGAAAGKVSLYRGKECVEKNIPQEEAVDRLVELIKREGQWIERP